VHGSAAIVNTTVVPRIIVGFQISFLAFGQVQEETKDEFQTLNACFHEFIASMRQTRPNRLLFHNRNLLKIKFPTRWP